MGIPFTQDSITISQRCIVYTEMSKEYELAAIFRIQGIRKQDGAWITPEDIREHAVAVAEAWGVRDPDKTHCYVCRAESADATRLCACYWTTLVSTYNIPEVFLDAPPNQLVVNTLCADCGAENNILARRVQEEFRATGKFRMFLFCPRCHSKHNKPQRGSRERFGAKIQDHAPKQLQALQREVAAATTTPSTEN